MTASAPQPVLSARRLTKSFSGVLALRGVSFDLRPGEIHALCGENGAGKSTLIKVLSGVWPHGSYEGEILVDGATAEFASVRDAERVGVAAICQELSLVDEMTAAQNIFLGREPVRFGLIDWDVVNRESRRLLDSLGAGFAAETETRRLGVGQKQLVEIAKALGKRSRVLILDEPTAALSGQEAEGLLDLVRGLSRQGMSCVYVSHKLDEVFAIASRITVLRDGASVATLSTDQTTPQEIIRHMVGREIVDLYPRRQPRPGATRLRVRDLDADPPAGVGPALKGISFEVRAGETLGIGGLMGAGRTELLLHLFGAWGRRVAGRVELDGAPLDRPTPGQAIERGLVLVSEDRKRGGLHLDQPIAFNLSLASLSRFRGPWGLINADAERNACQDVFRDVGIRAASLETAAAACSGGNQQKAVLGKALMARPRVLLLDEPTRGIDVGARAEIYDLISRLAAQGLAVVLVSSDLPELMAMSDRILMLAGGRMAGEFAAGALTQDELLAAAMGRERETAC